MSRFTGKLLLASFSLLVLGAVIATSNRIKLLPSLQSLIDEPVEYKVQVSSAGTANLFAPTSIETKKTKLIPDKRTAAEESMVYQTPAEQGESKSHSDDAEHLHLKQLLAEEDIYLTEKQLNESQENYDAIQQELARVAAQEEIIMNHPVDVVAVEQDFTSEKQSTLQTLEDYNYHLEALSAEQQAYADYLNIIGGEHLDSFMAEIQYLYDKSSE